MKKSIKPDSMTIFKIGFFAFLILLICSFKITGVFASTCSTYGNNTYCDDGTSYSTYGNTTYGSDGSSYSRYGNTTYSSDGTSYSQYGNTLYGSDGTSYSQYGNNIYGSDGSSYSTYGNTTYGSGNAYSTCPANSSYDYSTSKCSCNSGYSVNYSKTACTYTGYTAPTTPTCPLNSYYDGVSSCRCDYGYHVSGDSCVATPVSTSSRITPPPSTGGSCSSFGSGAEVHGTLCYCSVGYQWNTAINYCVAGYPTFTQYLTIGSTGTEVVNLKNLLAIKGLYTGYVSTAFDNATATALRSYQALHGISLTGITGPLTRTALNKSVISGN